MSIGVAPRNTNNLLAATNQDEVYMYPDLWVCLYDTYGCDKLEYEEQCVSSIFDTEGGSTSARYRPGDVDETIINVSANFTEEVKVLTRFRGTFFE